MKLCRLTTPARQALRAVGPGPGVLLPGACRLVSTRGSRQGARRPATAEDCGITPHARPAAGTAALPGVKLGLVAGAAARPVLKPVGSFFARRHSAEDRRLRGAAGTHRTRRCEVSMRGPCARHASPPKRDGVMAASCLGHPRRRRRVRLQWSSRGTDHRARRLKRLVGRERDRRHMADRLRLLAASNRTFCASRRVLSSIFRAARRRVGPRALACYRRSCLRTFL